MGKIIKFPQKNLEVQVENKIENMNVDNIYEINDLINLLLYNNEILIDNYFAYPIIKLANFLNIKVYTTEKLKSFKNGVLFAFGTTGEMYGNDPVIFVDESLDLKIQREIVAYLLGTYLLDCLKNYSDTPSKTYVANFKESLIHNKANYFTRQLLTPKDLFIKKYCQIFDEEPNNLFVSIYLSKYFQVSRRFVEERIYELAYDYTIPLEKNNGIKLSRELK